jgi:dynein heavy chain
MFQYESEINEISISATNEAALEKMLFKIIDLWNTTPLHLVLHHTETYSILVISSIDDILAQLEESQVVLTTIKGSPYLGPIKVNTMAKIKCLLFVWLVGWLVGWLVCFLSQGLAE